MDLDDLPGMWEEADFLGGAPDLVRGPTKPAKCFTIKRWTDTTEGYEGVYGVPLWYVEHLRQQVPSDFPAGALLAFPTWRAAMNYVGKALRYALAE